MFISVFVFDLIGGWLKELLLQSCQKFLIILLHAIQFCPVKKGATRYISRLCGIFVFKKRNIYLPQSDSCDHP